MKSNDIFHRFLNAYSSFTLTSHLNPDADAIGSVAAMYRYLKMKGKQVRVALDVQVPLNLRFLLQGIPVIHLGTQNYQEQSQAVIVLDCSNKRRTFFEENCEIWQKKVLNIDHHQDNTRFGHENILDFNASSTGEMLFDLCYEGRESFTAEIAEAIYAAVIGDTGGFRYANTSAKVLNSAALLLDYGLDVSFLNKQVLEKTTKKALGLISEALSTVKFYQDIATMQVDHTMLQRHQIEPKELPELVNYIRSIEGVDIAVLYLEPEQGLTKVSLRSQPHLDISTVARYFGGGGHKNAAGCKITGEFLENISKVNQQLSTLERADKT